MVRSTFIWQLLDNESITTSWKILFAQQPSLCSLRNGFLLILFVGGFIHWPIIKPHYVWQCVFSNALSEWPVGLLGPSGLFHMWVRAAHCRTSTHPPAIMGIHSHHPWRQSSPVYVVLDNGEGIKVRRLVLKFSLHYPSLALVISLLFPLTSVFLLHLSPYLLCSSEMLPATILELPSSNLPSPHVTLPKLLFWLCHS